MAFIGMSRQFKHKNAILNLKNQRNTSPVVSERFILTEIAENTRGAEKTKRYRTSEMFFFRRALAATFAIATVTVPLATPFVNSHYNTGWISPRVSAVSSSQCFVSTDPSAVQRTSHNDDNENDKKLLKEIPKSHLQDLCSQYNLSTKGTKQSLLQRLRAYANEQAEVERTRRRERITRVQEGGQNDKERYEIVNDYPEDDDEDEGYFYFQVPGNITDSASNETSAEAKKPAPKKPTYMDQTTITAPPPPSDMEPDENGERVVTVYSTKDHNDLTGVAAAQPGYNALSDNNAMMAGSESASPAPWDMEDSQRQSEASSKELEEAKETVAELVHVLLQMTGAAAFREEFSEGLTPIDDKENGRKASPASHPEGFVGFDPAKVPTDLLVSSSQALRAGRGQVLQDVLRDYELRAIGHDGMAGDDEERGGGHYREVSKVRAFLEGYRRAEVRRVARETVTVLLDKLVSEGIEGLDLLLGSMKKTSDDTGDVGELNDALLDFLNDAIRQQEAKVNQLIGPRTEQAKEETLDKNDSIDPMEGLWNVTNEDGKRVETLDPNDPRVQDVLKEEASKPQQVEELGSARPTPETASEQLLLLLTLLRDRIKAEAAFASDEKGRNLRTLAYCLHVRTDKDREDIIKRETRTSIDRLDSFIELVTSSIEYTESTTHQLQPARSRPLNVNQLKSILKLANDMRERQAYRASSATL